MDYILKKGRDVHRVGKYKKDQPWYPATGQDTWSAILRSEQLYPYKEHAILCSLMYECSPQCLRQTSPLAFTLSLSTALSSLSCKTAWIWASAKSIWLLFDCNAEHAWHWLSVVVWQISLIPEINFECLNVCLNLSDFCFVCFLEQCKSSMCIEVFKCGRCMFPCQQNPFTKAVPSVRVWCPLSVSSQFCQLKASFFSL